MTKKLLLSLLGVAAVGCFNNPVQAQGGPTAAAPAYTVTSTFTAVSQYMFRGQRLGGPSWQPAVEVGAGDFAAGIWSNLPFKDKVANSSDPEFDLYGSYTWNVDKQLSLVPTITVYTYPKAPTDQGYYRSSIEPSLALNYTLADVKFTPKIYYDVTLKGPTYELTAAYALPLKDLGTELLLSAQVGSYIQRDYANKTTPDVKAWGNYWQLGVSAPFQITKESKLTVGFAYTEGSDAFTKQGTTPKGVNTLAVGRGVVTVSYSFTF